MQISSIQAEEVANRHAALEAQLASLNLVSVDVAGDGNCLFRSVSHVMYCHQNAHLQLRKATASEIRQNGSAIFNIIDTCPDDNNSFTEHVRHLSTEGEAAGQDAVMAFARITKRSIYVHMAFTTPQVFEGKDQATAATPNDPIQIAFFEPGHYRAVVRNDIKPSSKSSVNL